MPLDSSTAGGNSVDVGDIGTLRALTFDVGGTVFDWHHSLRDEVSALAARQRAHVDAAAFVNQWRRRMFELLAGVRSGDIPWMNADQLHRMAIDDVAADHPTFDLSTQRRDELTVAWHRLRVWPDVPAALERLRTRFTVVVLTVLSWSLVVDSSKAAGLGWDGILSCEFLGRYKPDPEAYLAAVRLLGVAPGQAMMVAAHPWDLRAAAAAGLRTAYVPRPHEWGDGQPSPSAATEDTFDITATDFPDLARQLVDEA